MEARQPSVEEISFCLRFSMATETDACSREKQNNWVSGSRPLSQALGLFAERKGTAGMETRSEEMPYRAVTGPSRIGEGRLEPGSRTPS